MKAEENILAKPSRVELYESGLLGSAWLLFIGVAIILGSIAYYNISGDWVVVLGAWLLGGLLGYMGFLAVMNALKVERLRLAAHMLRSLSLHAVIAGERGDDEALRMLGEAEHRETGFIVKAFRAAGANVEQAFLESTVEGIRRGSEPPYILVYRNGVLDAPATLAANLTARTAGAVIGIFAFMLMGLIMLAVGGFNIHLHNQ